MSREIGMPLQPSYFIPELPPVGVDLQTPALLHALVAAHRQGEQP